MVIHTHQRQHSFTQSRGIAADTDRFHQPVSEEMPPEYVGAVKMRAADLSPLSFHGFWPGQRSRYFNSSWPQSLRAELLWLAFAIPIAPQYDAIMKIAAASASR
ncbi:hypothetical protein SAMN02927900_01717 [Rhizobium mongolense subsp. loessense]|uniref:Uncharacterized protein n=1 Tax=Rhizobium mongolense subsp. loessense TaxID=158890 RepID=A0A1G4QQA9_9HYPH|nr:hypothetical protein SAMN02927900_01717 [Rhizobium mongolense subsp. loessense]